RFVALPTPRNTTTTEHSSSTEARPADNAGRVLPNKVHSSNSSHYVAPDEMRHSSRHGSSTTTDAHFFYSAAVPLRPADNAGEVVLASSSSHAPVYWQSYGKKPTTTEAQNDFRTAGGSLDTYEDRTLGFMQQIRDLSDRFDRLAAQARSLQPSPEDPYQRLSQLYTSVRNAIDELRNDCTQYTSVMDAWDALNATLHTEDSAKASRMLRYRRFIFGYPTAHTKLLDEKQMDLLEHFNRVQQHIEDIVQHREDAARATRSSRALPADNAGGRRALSANEQQRTNLHREKQPLSTENTRKNAPQEQRPPMHRTGWKTARGGVQHRPQRSEADNATAAAPSRSLEADNATRLSRGRGPSPDRIKALMSSFASSAGAGRTTTFSSGPLQVGADGKPLSRSSANAKRPPSASGAAHFELHHTFVNQAEVLIAACALCNGPHPPSQCPRYDTTRKRLRRTRKLRYCFLCLEGSHRAGSCPKKTGIPCRHCSHGEHHPALCKDLHRRRKEAQAGLMCANKIETEQAQLKGPTCGPSTATPRAMICEPVSPTRSVRQEDYSVTWLKPTMTIESTVNTIAPPSAQISSTTGGSNSKQNRPSRHRNGEPLLMDRVARAAPTTVIDENTLAKDTHASDSDELLFMQKRLRQTDMCSTPDEM
ncbi:hypothetical protein AAVH_43651, partial [Aphelenchoides avenae]